MSEQQYNHGAAYTAPPRNTVGTTGFVFTLVALLLNLIGICCFITWIIGIPLQIIGFALCFFGMFKAPRGAAFAGIVINILVLVSLGGVLMLAGVTTENAKEYLGTQQTFAECRQILEGDEAEKGREPTVDEANILIEDFKDGWGTQIRAVKKPGGGIGLVSDGPDRIPGNSDDLKPLLAGLRK